MHLNDLQRKSVLRSSHDELERLSIVEDNNKKTLLLDQELKACKARSKSQEFRTLRDPAGLDEKLRLSNGFGKLRFNSIDP